MGVITFTFSLKVNGNPFAGCTGQQMPDRYLQSLAIWGNKIEESFEHLSDTYLQLKTPNDLKNNLTLKF